LAFGEHRFDIGRRELCRGAEPIGLEPTAFDLLIFLVENRDRAVSKEDLLRAVWGGSVCLGIRVDEAAIRCGCK
jgi:DNA-binding winged helix-turn-helix (wHTH) protein